ncbi:uncharacterized protein ARMOST_02149 [Armillaria ostoyae]|uniref:Uncharacterized protein n=1 Tax=Armillaria ostoyae TaxID=47428 RepID=A0A284QQY6_ARMOS|nr:uncharacterized protein ARMOST_02149 [Armillaria ostoyae]
MLIFTVSDVSGEQGYSVIEVIECLWEVQVRKHMYQDSASSFKFSKQSSQPSYSRTTTFTLPQHFDWRVHGHAILGTFGTVPPTYLMAFLCCPNLDAHKGSTSAVDGARALDISWYFGPATSYHD